MIFLFVASFLFFSIVYTFVVVWMEARFGHMFIDVNEISLHVVECLCNCYVISSRLNCKTVSSNLKKKIDVELHNSTGNIATPSNSIRRRTQNCLFYNVKCANWLVQWRDWVGWTCDVSGKVMQFNINCFKFEETVLHFNRNVWIIWASWFVDMILN